MTRASTNIVLIHGMAGAAAVFDDVTARLRELAPGTRCHALDLPGHGERVAERALDDVTALTDDVAARVIELGVERAVVVGHSLGGAVAQMLAVRHGELVERLVLVSSTLRFPVAQTMLAMFDADAAGFRTMFGDGLGRGAARCRALLDSTTDATLRADIVAAAGYDSREHALRCPALVVAGDVDEITPLKATRRLAEVRAAELVEVRGHGHMLPETAADDVARAILRFST